MLIFLLTFATFQLIVFYIVSLYEKLVNSSVLFSSLVLIMLSALLRCVRLASTKTTNPVTHRMDPPRDAAFVVLQGGDICSLWCGSL